MGLPRQEYWGGLLFPSPGNLPDPGIKPVSPMFPALQADSLPTEPPGKPNYNITTLKKKKVCCAKAFRFDWSHLFIFVFIFITLGGGS